MLKIVNDANWEKSERTSLFEPSVYADANTIYLPVNIREVSVPFTEYNLAGEAVGTFDKPGYSYDEYRINRAIDLPEEAATTLATALYLNLEENADMRAALEMMGVLDNA